MGLDLTLVLCSTLLGTNVHWFYGSRTRKPRAFLKNVSTAARSSKEEPKCFDFVRVIVSSLHFLFRLSRKGHLRLARLTSRTNSPSRTRAIGSKRNSAFYKRKITSKCYEKLFAVGGIDINWYTRALK